MEAVRAQLGHGGRSSDLEGTMKVSSYDMYAKVK